MTADNQPIACTLSGEGSNDRMRSSRVMPCRFTGATISRCCAGLAPGRAVTQPRAAMLDQRRAPSILWLLFIDSRFCRGRRPRPCPVRSEISRMTASVARPQQRQRVDSLFSLACRSAWGLPLSEELGRAGREDRPPLFRSNPRCRNWNATRPTAAAYPTRRWRWCRPLLPRVPPRDNRQTLPQSSPAQASPCRRRSPSENQG